MIILAFILEASNLNFILCFLSLDGAVQIRACCEINSRVKKTSGNAKLNSKVGGMIILCMASGSIN